MSGSLQGAGGIGGLLCMSKGGTNYLYTFDGNGNVTDVLNDTGNVVAHYEFSPFGRIIEKSGSYADNNAWRFSTKWQDDNWGLIFYEMRVYSPNVARWLSRDPIYEIGGINLYHFSFNSPLSWIDLLGLLTESQCDALKKVLEMEKELGTHETARQISNTWRKTGLLQEFNSDRGYDSTVNGVDIDWFTDLTSVADASFPFFPTTTYILGKTYWGIVKMIIADLPFDYNMLPFREAEERVAVRKVELRRRYSDIITSKYLEKECPEKDKCEK